MNQFLIGALVLALVGLGAQTWRASSLAQDAAVAESEVSQLGARLAQLGSISEAHRAGFESLDLKLVALATFQQHTAGLLETSITALDNFKPQPEDTDETVKCARLPVPVDVDRSLRHEDGLPAQ